MIHRPTPLRQARGAVLIVALILTAIIAIGLGAYLRLGQTALRLSHSNYHRQLALNLALTAIEEAVWETNHGNWNGWIQRGAANRDRQRTFSHPNAAPGVDSTVNVYVSDVANRRAPYPTVLVRTLVFPRTGPAVERWFKVELAKRSFFENGLLASETLHFTGTYASVDSYNSRLGNFNERQKDGSRNRSAQGRIAGRRVVASGVDAASRDIFGYIAVGNTGGQPDLSLHPEAILSGDLDAERGTVATERILPTFAAALKDRETPKNEGIGLGSITQSTTLPRPGDTPDADGKFYYDVEAIVISGMFHHLTILRDVVIRIRAPFAEAITVTGANSGIIVAPYAKLNLYVSTDVTLAGGGVANNNPPGHFALWGTRTSDNITPQRLRISGNGHLNAAIYAPNGQVTLNGGGIGGGTVRGAVAARQISFNADDFHYDEALVSYDFGEPMGLGRWHELTTPEERTAYSSQLN